MYTEEELLSALREFTAKEGRPPTVREANDHEQLPNGHTFIRRFGCWNGALDAAGCKPRNRRRSDEELLNDLQAFAAENGRPPTVTEANSRENFPAVDTFVRHFGSWNTALSKAGLEPRKRHRSNEELIEDLQEFASGGYPSQTEVANCEKMADPSTYHEHFGSWLTALEAADIATVDD
jgi:SOS-response transcriptional repressor LexA